MYTRKTTLQMTARADEALISILDSGILQYQNSRRMHFDCIRDSGIPLVSVFFFPVGIFFSVSDHLQFFFGFPLENIIYVPTTSANWWENVGKRIFWWEKVVVPRGYTQNFPPIYPPFPSGKKKHCIKPFLCGGAAGKCITPRRKV